MKHLEIIIYVYPSLIISYKLETLGNKIKDTYIK